MMPQNPISMKTNPNQAMLPTAVNAAVDGRVRNRKEGSRRARKVRALEFFDLTGRNVSSISILALLPKLKRLHLYERQVTPDRVRHDWMQKPEARATSNLHEHLQPTYLPPANYKNE
jgi:hypothetical protein